MPFDEQHSPDADPPVVDPPPVTAVVSGILAHPTLPRTEVVAPLKPVPSQPVETEPVEPELVQPEPVEPEPVEPEALASEPVEPTLSEILDEERVSRWCELCGDRVEVYADADRCWLGHRLSPAHARRRWWQRRR